MRHRSAHATTWGQRIAAARRAKNPPLTQVELAAAVGVNQATVSCWELGQYAPSDIYRVPIARALGVPPEDLFSYDTDGNGDEAAA